MRRSRKPIVIASRKSALARTQAEAVGRALGRLNPAVSVEYCWIESEGDRFQDRSLADTGGKGLFTAAVEKALLSGHASLAVHSLKDMPTQETPGLSLAAIPKRADVRDCLVARDGVVALDQLKDGAVIGTSSPRRAAQLKRIRGDFVTTLMRGNIQTRVKKVLEEAQYDATLMAMAGLLRGGMGGYAKYPIDVESILPSAAQGALALQCRADDHVTLQRCLPLNDPITASAVHAERQVIDSLGGDCHSPIAVLAEPVEIGADHGYRLRARVLNGDGSVCIEADEQSTVKHFRRMVNKVVKQLKDGGAAEVLAAATAAPGINGT